MTAFEIVVRALSETIVSIDLTDDEEIDLDLACALLEQSSAILEHMDKEGRGAFAEIVTRYAELETNDVRKQALRELPEILGFLD